MKLQKVKEFVQKIELKKLLKHCVLSIVILYFIISLAYLLLMIIRVKDISVGENLEFYLSYTEEDINSFKDDALQIIKENEDSNSLNGTITDYTSKYPNAMYLFYTKCAFLSEMIDTLKISIFLGLFIGIATYLYSKSTNIVKLIIEYIVLITIVLIANELMIRISIMFSDESAYVLSGGWNCDETLAATSIISILLVIIKFIKNKINTKKLNEYMQEYKNKK